MEIISPAKGHRTATNVTTSSSSATLLSAANTRRKSISFQNQGSVTVFLGGSDVAASGAALGYALFAGATFTDNASNEAWYALAASATPIVYVLEVA